MNTGMISLQAANPVLPSCSTATPAASMPLPRALLASYRPLANLSEADLQSLMQWSKIRTLKRREVLFRQGDQGGTVVLVVEGYLKLSRTLVDGREIVLDIIGPGACLGEMTVMNRASHDADATALSRVLLLAIDGRKFKQALEPRPEALLAMMRSVGERLNRATEQVMDARGCSAPMRLAKTLLHMASLQSPALNARETVRLRLSQTDLGAMTGLTRESVNKILGVWRDAGWITLACGVITLIDTTSLTRLLRDEIDPAS